MKDIIIRFKSDGETNALKLTCAEPKNMVITEGDEVLFCEPNQDILGLSSGDIRVKAVKECLSEILVLLNEME